MSVKLQKTMQRCDYYYLSFEVSRPKGIKAVDLLVTARLTGYEPKIFRLDDANKRATFETNVGTVSLTGLKEYFSFIKIKEEFVRQPAGWLLTGEFGQPLTFSYNHPETILSAMQVDAFDEHGQRAIYQTEKWDTATDGTDFHWQFGFDKKPASVILKIPHKPIQSFQTFSFPHIPLVRDDFHSRPLEAPPP